MLIVPGFSFASAISSFTLLAGRAGLAIRMNGTEPTLVTPEKSAIGSNDRLRLSALRIVRPFENSISVWPSAGDLAALATPGTPGRFSTITCWRQFSASFSPTVRARMSVTLPAEIGTMTRTSWFGNVWDCAAAPRTSESGDG